MSALDWQFSTTDWVLFLVAVVVFLYFLGTRNFSKFTKTNVPHPKPLPFLGNMAPTILKGVSFPNFLLSIYNETKDHKFAGFFMFNTPIYIINDPELIKTVGIKDFEHFTDHRDIVLETEGPQAVWSKGIFSLKGQRWREMRSALSPSFTSSKMKTMFVLISECCKQVLKFLEECNQKDNPSCNISKDGKVLVLEFKEFFSRYASDVIATTAFGIGVDSLNNPKNEFFVKGREATSLGILRFFGFVAFPKLMQKLKIGLVPLSVTQFFSSLVIETMQTRKKNGIVRPDMLQLLMEAKENCEKEETSTEIGKSKKISLDDEDIIAQALLFFLGGFDTTTSLLSFVCYELAAHPDIQTRLQDEIDGTLEDKGEFTYEVVNGMKYLDMVVNETLRMYPPASGVNRVCTRKYTLKSDPPVEIQLGEDVVIPIYGLHHDPRYFPEPEKFDPERFSDENKHKINSLTYLPFGVGPRLCMGNRFALMTAKLVLVHMLSKYNVVQVKKTPKTVNIIQKGFNISIDGGFWMGLEPRS